MPNEIKSARDALENTLEALKSLSKAHGTDLPEDVRALLGEIAFTVNAALALPRRNCEAGNTENQHARFVEFCRTNNCDKCPLFSRHGMSMCFAQWAQMPYEETEGGAK